MLGVAGLLGGEIIEVNVPKGTMVTLNIMFGFFALNCTTGSGYNEYPIVGYTSVKESALLLAGFYNNATFDSDGKLVITGLDTTDLHYKGILLGNNR